MGNNKPKLIQFPSIGNSQEGYITISEHGKNIPFEVKRVYWTYFTPHNVIRGFHAHRKLEQIIFAVSGSILFKLETRDGKKTEFLLDKPEIGLYIPPYTWREIQFSHNGVLLCLASDIFDESDYIRDYNEFKDEIGK